METNNIINIPEGFEIDKEQSTEHQIENQRSRSWEEYCQKMRGKDSYYYDGLFEKVKSSKFGSSPILPEFEDKEYVEVLVAFCKLVHLRRDWIGEWEPNWNDNTYKYQIITHRQQLSIISDMYSSHPMTFPTPEMRNEFLDCFKDYLEQAKPLL